MASSCISPSRGVSWTLVIFNSGKDFSSWAISILLLQYNFQYLVQKRINHVLMCSSSHNAVPIAALPKHIKPWVCSAHWYLKTVLEHLKTVIYGTNYDLLLKGFFILQHIKNKLALIFHSTNVNMKINLSIVWYKWTLIYIFFNQNMLMKNKN